jgi:NTE family protein
MRKQKYALVLSGGGFKGAFQAGAIQYMSENWERITGEPSPMKFDIIAGVSVGSLNGVLVAMNKLEVMINLWKDVGQNAELIYTSEFIDTKAAGEKVKFKLDPEKLKKKFFPDFKFRLNLGKLIQVVFSKKKKEQIVEEVLKQVIEEAAKNLSTFKALADNRPLYALLQKHVRRAEIQPDTVFICGSVSLANGKYYSYRHLDFDDDAELQKAVLASTAMPVVWEPVNVVRTKIETSTHLVDGGIRNVSPLKDVIDHINADPDGIPYRVFIINCNTGKVEIQENPDKMNIAEIAVRSLNDIAITEIFNDDLKEFLRINDLVLQAEEGDPVFRFKNYDYDLRQRTDNVLRYFRTDIIEPDPGVLGDTLVANPEIIERRIRHGREKMVKLS